MSISRRFKMIHVRLTEEQYDALDELTRGSAVSYSQVMRLALTEYLNRMEDSGKLKNPEELV